MATLTCNETVHRLLQAGRHGDPAFSFWLLMNRSRLPFPLIWLTMNGSEVFVKSDERVERVSLCMACRFGIGVISSMGTRGMSLSRLRL